MSYSAKIHKKCSFPKMGERIIPRKKKGKTQVKRNQSQILKDWRDSWFKGEYESKR